MKKFLKGIFFLLITALILSLSSCGIPNYSPIDCVYTNFKTEDFVNGNSLSYIDITGKIVTDTSLYNEILASQFPRICFFYAIVPENDESYLTSLVSAFNSRFVSNTCHEPFTSDKRFLTTKISSSDSTEVSLYQFVPSDSSLLNNVSYIYGLNSFEQSSTEFRSYINFEFDKSKYQVRLIFTDSSGNSKSEIILNRFNGKKFTKNSSTDGESFIGNEVPDINNYADSNLTLYIFYSVEVGFNTYSNYQHTKLNRLEPFKKFSLDS